MNIKIKSIPDPSNIEIELSFKATLEELENLISCIKDITQWPISNFRNEVQESIDHFYLNKTESVKKP